MTRHQPEAERRAQILRAARTVFVERGYLAARVQDVARHAGLSKGAVYFYFSSKKELFDALVEEEHAVAAQLLEGAAADSRPARDKLVSLGEAYLSHFGSLKNPPRFFLLMNEMAIRDEGIRAQVSEIHERFLAQLTELLEDGIAQGDFVQLDSRALAILLKAMVDGLAGQWAVGLRPDVAQLSSDGIRRILDGITQERDGGGTTAED